jgi:tetratricopeptide (TPR) repeat protein
VDKELPELPDYGDGGDLAGAHRNRRAFRLCVISIALLTFGLWMGEHSMRYGKAESAYKNSLTQEDRNSARVQLVSAIKIDKESNETQTAKYTQAWATRSEDDVILQRYDEAQAIDDRNSAFTLRHASRLFILGYPQRALAKYQKSEQLLDDTSSNALIGYLQSAAIAQQRNDPGAMNDAMVLTARTNNKDGDITFPKPHWFFDYPQDGTQYARLQRAIVDESCAPLFAFKELINRAIARKIENEQFQDAKTWIDHTKKMGERLILNSNPGGTLQALAGVEIYSLSVELNEKLEVAQLGAASEETIAQRIELSNIKEELLQYETDRDSNIAEAKNFMKRPWFLGMGTWFILVAVWTIIWCIYKLFHLQKSAWTLQHSPFGKLTLGGGTIAFLVHLLMFSALAHMQDQSPQSVTMLTWTWFAILALLVLLGLIYPATMLTNVEDASRKAGRPEEVESIIPYAKIVYRRVYASLALRYYGILVGFYTMSLCLWIVLYRLALGLYPWNINLLADGLLGKEIELVSKIASSL